MLMTLWRSAMAVVHDADELTTQQMAHFARWTNLSETTFLSAPTEERADYQVRIVTAHVEIPFAGHPTLGSAHLWCLPSIHIRGDRRAGRGQPALRRRQRERRPRLNNSTASGLGAKARTFAASQPFMAVHSPAGRAGPRAISGPPLNWTICLPSWTERSSRTLIDADDGRIYGWSVGAAGALEPVGSWEGLPATVAGLAAS